MKKYSTIQQDNSTLMRVDAAMREYPLSRGQLMRLADKAGAVRRVGRTVLIVRAILDGYIAAAGSGDLLEK